jgi:hypothetical protein
LTKTNLGNEYVLNFLNLVIQHPLFDLVWGTFVDMWHQNEKKFDKLKKLDDALMESVKKSTYYGINVAEWKDLGLSATVIKTMSSGVIDAKDAVGRIRAFLRVADEFKLLDKKFSYTAKGAEKTAAAFYAPIVLWNAVSTLPKPKQGFTPANKANKVSVKTEQRGFVRKEKKVENESNEAAAAAGKTTNSASAQVTQSVNDVLSSILQGEWFAVKGGAENTKMSS